MNKEIKKTKCLKLTKLEWRALENKNLSHLGIGLLYTQPISNNQGIDILDVDKFVEFIEGEADNVLYKSILSKVNKKRVKIKKYEIEYRLHYDKYSFDTISRVFEGENKTDALKNYNRLTGIPKSKVMSVNRVDNI